MVSTAMTLQHTGDLTQVALHRHSDCRMRHGTLLLVVDLSFVCFFLLLLSFLFLSFVGVCGAWLLECVWLSCGGRFVVNALQMRWLREDVRSRSDTDAKACRLLGVVPGVPETCYSAAGGMAEGRLRDTNRFPDCTQTYADIGQTRVCAPCVCVCVCTVVASHCLVHPPPWLFASLCFD